MANTFIHWVIALRLEAEPLIRRLHLKPVAGSNGKSSFPVWESSGPTESGITHRLVLSGIGKINAAAAATWLQATLPGRNDSTLAVAWINFGISGHRTRTLGNLVRASRATDFATEKSWYPPAVWKRKVDVASSPLRTVDAPSSAYPEADCMLDMEASGVFAVATRFSSLELVQSIKVISDNAAHSIESITKDSVREMCCAAIEGLDPWLEAYCEIAREETIRIQPPLLYDELINRIRFSETQKHQLRRMLIRHHASGTELQGSGFSQFKTGREVIAALNAMAIE